MINMINRNDNEEIRVSGKEGPRLIEALKVPVRGTETLNLTQGFHYSGSQMLINKGGIFHNGGIFHRNSTDNDQNIADK